MFADDTQLDRSSSDVNIVIVTNALNDFKNVSDWLSTNKLSLNTEKTEYMIIGSHQRLRSIETEPAIYLGANKIKRVKSTKSLGLMLDETLSWNEQINALSNKVNKSLNVIKRLREFVHLETLLIAYKTLVQPLNYTVHRYGEATDPHFQINYSVYKTERYRYALSLSVDTMSVPIFFYKI